ncbi:FAD-binding oxidoreductase [Edaphobacter aggregans]|uniref:FAD-binding oxidoreductase n=1 Tax=Edaphobacter aggregans TaxID=570835 RepID=UPI0005510CFD|nr:2Fe-2S iron-sulfur cluster binding domain-containing protein [Edaphobacter aggregans]
MDTQAVSTTQVTLLTRDGTQMHFPCRGSETILAAAEAAGYHLPAICHGGFCGVCHARVTQGRYQMGLCTESALPHTDSGQVLLCRCTPEEDVSVELPYNNAQILQQKVPARTAVIESLKPAWSGAMAVTLRLNPDAELGLAVDFRPGQYMKLTIPGTDTKRAYSLTNVPNWEGRLEFLIRLRPGGVFSTWLQERAAVGDTLTVRGPLGGFVLDEASLRPRCMIGGGCGIAPVLSMLRHMAEFQDSQPVHLIFGANREAELMPAEEIARLKQTLPQLDVTLAVLHPEPGWTGFTGNAAEALAAHLAKNSEEPDLYVCGPPQMIEAVETVAEQHGLEDRVIAERL